MAFKEVVGVPVEVGGRMWPEETRIEASQTGGNGESDSLELVRNYSDLGIVEEVGDCGSLQETLEDLELLGLYISETGRYSLLTPEQEKVLTIGVWLGKIAGQRLFLVENPGETGEWQKKGLSGREEIQILIDSYKSEAAGLNQEDKRKVFLEKIIDEIEVSKKLLGQVGDVDWDDRDLLENVVDLGDVARQTLVKHNLRLVIWTAFNYFDSGVNILDLIQAGNIGLMKAAKKFDFRKGWRFSTYATWGIKSAILREISDFFHPMTLPRGCYGRSMSWSSLQEVDAFGRLNGEIIPDQKARMPEKEISQASLRRHLFEVLAGLVREERVSPRNAAFLMLSFGLINGDLITEDEIRERWRMGRREIREILNGVLEEMRPFLEGDGEGNFRFSREEIQQVLGRTLTVVESFLEGDEVGVDHQLSPQEEWRFRRLGVVWR